MSSALVPTKLDDVSRLQKIGPPFNKECNYNFQFSVMDSHILAKYWHGNEVDIFSLVGHIHR